MFRPPLVAADFPIPTLATDRYRLEPLTMRWLLQDYAAVVESWDHLDGLMEAPGKLGPVSGYRLEDNMVELGWHEREFRTRKSFAFAAITPDDQRSVGCAYLYGTPRPDVDAVLLTWARWDPLHRDADARLYAEVRHWVDTAWPFTTVVAPGRDVPWEEWS